MPERTDDAAWELAGPIRVRPSACGWSFLGGWEDADGVGLNFVVHHPDDAMLLRRVSVRLPLSVDGSDLVVGDPVFGEPT